MVPAEEKQFVLDDRSPEYAAKLVALQPIPLRGERVARIEDFVPNELKQVAVKLVCTRLRYSINCTCGVLSILGRHGTGFNFEFLQRIWEWQRLIETAVRVVMRTSVQHVCQAAGQSPADRDDIRWVLPVCSCGASADGIT